MRVLPPLLVLASIAAGMAAAQADSPAAGAQTNWFKVHDRNGDGYITFD